MKFSILLLCILLAGTAWAQRHEPVNIPPIPKGTQLRGLDPARAITDYMHSVWTTQQGLPQNSVTALCQTRDGYLWIGTEEGLVRYDGVRFVVFDKSNTPTLTGNVIFALVEDREGVLWIGTFGGLNRMKDGVFTSYTTKNGLSNDNVRSLLQDREGVLWIGTFGGGLNRMSRDDRGNVVFTSYTTKNGLSNDNVRSLLQDREGALWIGTYGGGLNHMSHDNRGKVVFTSYTTKNGLSNDNVWSLLQDREGDLWIGTYGGGLNHMSHDNRGKVVFTSYTTKNGLSNDNVWSLLQDREGDLWIGTYGGGLNRMSHDDRGNTVFTSYTAKNGLSSDVVISLLQDREGTLWIGTQGGGLNRLKDVVFTSYTAKNGLSNDVVWSLLQDREGALWIGTDGGLNRMGRDNRGNVVFKSYTTKNGLSNNVINSLLQDREGALWIGTNGGLNRMSQDNRGNVVFKSYTTKNGLSHDDVHSLLQDREGALWIGTWGGLNRMSQDNRGNVVFTGYKTKNGLSNDFVWSLLQDREGALWIGTDGGGLNHLKDGLFTSYTTKNGLSNDVVRSLLRDSDGALWIGTRGGVNRLKDGKFTAFTMKNGLFDDGAWCILEDDSGYFWVSCNRGIYRVRKADLNAFADGKLQHISCTAFGTADGMKNVECNGRSPAGWKDTDGCLWFPTMEGVVKVNPQKLYSNPLPPPVIIEEIKADSLVLDLSTLVNLPAGTEKFEFHYTATSLLAPERVKFKYLLEGYDKEWTDGGTRRVAYYTSLPRGRTYRFRVTACNNNGVWNEEGAAAMFYLAPYFWETWWFYGGCGMFVVLLGFGAYRLRVRQLQQRAEALERIVAERTAELLDANAELGTANEEISRQMGVQIEQAREIELANTALQEAHERSEELLLNVLPAPIAERLKAGERTIADHFDAVTVLFADVVGFTTLSASTTPKGLVSLLDKLFSRFDRLAELYGLEKIKTIGDAYMVVGGLPIASNDHCERAALFALALQPLVNELAGEFEIKDLAVRVGMHTGEVVAGVIGHKKFTYDLWGDTVNMASRMESHGEPGRIHCTEDVVRQLSLVSGHSSLVADCRQNSSPMTINQQTNARFIFEERGEIEVKGKGLMRTWYLTGCI